MNVLLDDYIPLQNIELDLWIMSTISCIALTIVLQILPSHCYIHWNVFLVMTFTMLIHMELKSKRNLCNHICWLLPSNQSFYRPIAGYVRGVGQC